MFQRFVQEVSKNASENSLMSHQKNIALSLQLHHDRLQAGHQVLSDGKLKNISLSGSPGLTW